jgi:hypothetical protein
MLANYALPDANSLELYNTGVDAAHTNTMIMNP